jgi:hypothetical protein
MKDSINIEDGQDFCSDFLSACSANIVTIFEFAEFLAFCQDVFKLHAHGLYENLFLEINIRLPSSDNISNKTWTLDYTIHFSQVHASELNHGIGLRYQTFSD